VASATALGHVHLFFRHVHLFFGHVHHVLQQYKLYGYFISFDFT
jgi:hypothetical protein